MNVAKKDNKIDQNNILFINTKIINWQILK